ncbi:transposable element Tcb2 transposase [Trichonephila clavipes]|nr:transposable element Tcb2 transposase [Trichonephila clavipes]
MLKVNTMVEALEMLVPWNKKDNCTSHKSRLATGWLDEPASDFSVMNWSPRSPDINPIEHLWDVLEQGVKCHHTAPTIRTELWTALANIWKVILMERFQKLLLDLCLVVRHLLTRPEEAQLGTR